MSKEGQGPSGIEGFILERFEKTCLYRAADFIQEHSLYRRLGIGFQNEAVEKAAFTAYLASYQLAFAIDERGSQEPGCISLAVGLAASPFRGKIEELLQATVEHLRQTGDELLGVSKDGLNNFANVFLSGIQAEREFDEFPTETMIRAVNIAQDVFTKNVRERNRAINGAAHQVATTVATRLHIPVDERVNIAIESIFQRHPALKLGHRSMRIEAKVNPDRKAELTDHEDKLLDALAGKYIVDSPNWIDENFGALTDSELLYVVNTVITHAMNLERWDRDTNITDQNGVLAQYDRLLDKGTDGAEEIIKDIYYHERFRYILHQLVQNQEGSVRDLMEMVDLCQRLGIDGGTVAQYLTDKAQE